MDMQNALKARIAWAAEAVEAAVKLGIPVAPLWSGGPTPSTYVEGLVRTPGNGSWVEGVDTLEGLEKFLAGCTWAPMKPGHPGMREGCEYFVGVAPKDTKAFTGVRRLGDLSPAELRDVEVVIGGEHALVELLIAKGAAHPTGTVTGIVDKDGLVTWYPGWLSVAAPERLSSFPVPTEHVWVQEGASGGLFLETRDRVLCMLHPDTAVKIRVPAVVVAPADAELDDKASMKFAAEQ